MLYTTVMNCFYCILIIALSILSIQCHPYVYSLYINPITKTVELADWIEPKPHASSNLLAVVPQMQTENIIRAYVKSDSNRTLRLHSVSNTECNLQLSMFFTGLMARESWAQKMLKSSSEIPPEMLVSSMKDLGSYDDCISIKVKKDERIIEGHHCMYALSGKEPNATIPWNSTLSICLPAACNSEDVALMMQNAIDETSGSHDVSLRIGSTKCTTIAPVQWDIDDVVVITIVTIFMIFLFICTILDVFIRVKSDSKIQNVMIHELAKFSFYTNAKRILDTTITNDNYLPAIHGLRFFSMFWMIFSYNYARLPVEAVAKIGDISGWINSWQSIYILIAPFSVDTFFLLSGFLTSYFFLKKMSKGQTFNLFTYYAHRYIRLTPSLGAILLLAIYIFPKIGSGALWEPLVSPQTQFCSNSWWTIVLYVQNLVYNDYTRCLTHTWYLAVDMQLFWISPLILYPLAKKPKLGLIILVVFLIASIITPPLITGEYQFFGVLSTDLQRMETTLINFYMKIYTRSGPWLLGIFLGYQLVDKKHKLSNNSVYLGWILIVLMLVFAFSSYTVLQSDGYQWNITWVVFYAACVRHIWVFSVSWIIYACVSGHGSSFTEFLSFPIFIPFSRIFYSIYLTNLSIVTMMAGGAQSGKDFNEFHPLYSSLRDLILCSFGGFVFSLIFESPFIVLEKIIIEKWRNVGEKDGGKNNDNCAKQIENKY